MFPLSVAELLHSTLPQDTIRLPQALDAESFSALLKFGGYPEPLEKASDRFFLRWSQLRHQQLFYEDIRSLTQIQEVEQLELLAELLRLQAGQLVNYSKLATQVNASVDSIRRWSQTLQSFYYCFFLRPWFKNVKKSLRKEPKAFLWNWAFVEDPGSRFENFVATHLLKAVYFWNDMGLGEYGLFFLRDTEKREVDFLITQNQQPWILIEVKSTANSLTKSLHHFQKQLQAPHCFQVVLNMDYVEQDCFSIQQPIVVPAQTLLSQLI